MRQIKHLRRSKRGKVFRAGRGTRRNYGMAWDYDADIESAFRGPILKRELKKGEVK